MAGFRSSRLEIILLLFFFIASVPVLSAPYLNEAREDSQKQIPLDHFFRPSQGLIGPLFRQNDISLEPPPSQGVCHYQLRYYEEGERIDTKEPCLNCTCHNSMLMCYLKVCPFSKPIGKDCTVEKSPDQCCPVITCPQVPVNLQLMHMPPWPTTSAPMPSTALAHATEHGCSIEGQYYPDGAQVPGDSSKPCELCYCIRNHTACIMQECILKVDGCEPVFENGICCPVRYMCAHDKQIAEQILTTTLAPNGTILTTTLQPSLSGGCTHDGEFYADGALIDSSDPCEHCYCMNSDVVCAIQECRSPLDEEDENCIPRAPPPGQCCPEAYDCQEDDVRPRTGFTPRKHRLDDADTLEATTPLPESIELPSKVETTPEAVDDKEDMDKPSTEKVEVDKTIQTEEEEPATVSVSQTTEDIESITEPSKEIKPDVETEITVVEETVDASTRPQIEELPSTSTPPKLPDVLISEEKTPAKIHDITEQVSTHATPSKDPIEKEPEPQQEIIFPEDGETFAVQPEMPTEVEVQEDPEDIKVEEGATESSIKPEETTFSIPEVKETTKETLEISVTDEPKEPEYLTTIATDVEQTTEKPEKEDVLLTTRPEIITPDEEPPKETLVQDLESTAKYPEEISETPEYEKSTTLLPDTEQKTELPEKGTTIASDHEEDDKDITTSRPVVDYEEVTIPFIETLITEQPSVSPDITAQPEKIDETTSTTPKYEEEIHVSSTERPESDIPEEKQTDVPEEQPELTSPATPPHELSHTPETEPESVCNANGTLYRNGENVPVLNQCQESCTCKNSIIICQFRACPSPPPVFLRCDVKEEQGDCCPQYDCPLYGAPEEPLSPNCIRDGIQYREGDFVPSKDLCTDCYCLYGDVVCAFQECPEYGEGCKPLEMPKGSCCPTKYECPEMEVGDMIMETEEKEVDPAVTTTAAVTITDDVGADVTEEPITTDELITDHVTTSTIDYQTKEPAVQPVDKEQTTVPSMIFKPEETEVTVTDETIETTSEPIAATAQPDEEIEKETATTYPELTTEEIIITTQPEEPDEYITTISDEVTTSQPKEIDEDISTLRPEEVPVESDAIVEEFTTQTVTISEEPETTEKYLVTQPESVTDDYAIESTTSLKEDTEETPDTSTDVPEIVTEKIPTDSDISTIAPELVTESETEKEKEIVTDIHVVTEKIITPEILLTTEMVSVTEEIETVTDATSQPEVVTEDEEIIDHTPTEQPDKIDEIKVTTTLPEIFTDVLEPEVTTADPEIITEEKGKEEEEVTTIQLDIDTEKPDAVTEYTTFEPELVTEDIDYEIVESSTQAKIDEVPIDTAITTSEPEIVTEDIDGEIVESSTQAKIDEVPIDTAITTSEPKVVTEKIDEVEETTMQLDIVTEPAEVVTERPVEEIESQPELVTEVTDPSVEMPETSTFVDSETLTVQPEETTIKIEPTADTTTLYAEIVTEEADIIKDTTVAELEQVTEEILTEQPILEDVEVTTKYHEPEDVKITEDEVAETTPVSSVIEKEIEDDLPDEEEPSTSKYPEDITTTTKPKDYEEIEIDIQEAKATEMPETLVTSEIEATDKLSTAEPVLTKEPHVPSTYLPPELTTEEAVTEPEEGIPGEGHCLLNGTEYKNGDSVPKSSQCQEECTCKDSVVTCQLKACPAPPPVFLRCEVSQQPDECCPSYECPVVTSQEPSPKCKQDGVQYLEGDFVPSEDICTDCYCLYGEIVCATLECPPMPKGCIRAEINPESCCPTKYECPELEAEAISTTSLPEAIAETEPSTYEPEIQDDIQKEMITEEPSVQTDTPSEDETEKSTVTDDILSVTEETYPKEPEIGVEITTITAIPEELSTQAYIEESDFDTTEKIETETPEEIQPITTEKTLEPITDAEFSTKSPEELTDQDPSTEAITVQAELQTIPSTDVPSMIPIDIETKTTILYTDEDVTATPALETIESYTESSVESETGKYTSKPDDVTVISETTGEFVADEMTTQKTIVETVSTEKEILTELPTTVMTDIETTTELAERPTDKPEKETPVETLPETETPELVEAKPKEDNKCLWLNNTYDHGSSVPTDSECQDFCKCDNETVKCKHRACPPVPPSFLRCAASSSNDTCCPTYDCAEPAPSDHFCLHEGMIYNNGDYIPSGTECLDCYCLEGEVVCASLECGVPRGDCKSLVQRDSDCCPILYECTESPIESGEFMILPEDETEISVDDLTTVSITSEPATQDLPEDDLPESDLGPTLSADPEIETTFAHPEITDIHPVTETTKHLLDTTTPVSGVAVDTTIKPDEVYGDKVTTVKAEEVYDIVTSAKPEVYEEELSTVKLEDHEDKVTIRPEETTISDKDTEVDETFTTPSELVSQPTSEKILEDKTTEPTKILTTESAIDETADDKLSTIPSTFSKLPEPETTSYVSVTEAPLTDIPEEDETEKPTIKPEEIVSPAKNDTDKTHTITTQSPVSEEITSKDTLAPSIEDSSTTITPASPTEIKEPSVSLVEAPEKSIVEAPVVEDSEPEPPFPPFPGDISDISEDDVVDKEMRPEAPFSPFSPFPEDTPSLPEETVPEKPEDEMPQILLPPELSDMYGETYLPPHILNETISTTTWKPKTTTELVLGPGNCLFDRKVYASAEQIPRDDPCDFCFCFRGDIICLQQTCPDPIDGCYEEDIPGFCCPRYECPVRQEIVNITTTTPSPIPGFPPIKKTSRVAMCEIEGRHYASGEVVKSASSPCHECICGTDGFMKCIPKECDTKRKIYKYGYR